jgi:hypothetical protein
MAGRLSEPVSWSIRIGAGPHGPSWACLTMPPVARGPGCSETCSPGPPRLHLGDWALATEAVWSWSKCCTDAALLDQAGDAWTLLGVLALPRARAKAGARLRQSPRRAGRSGRAIALLHAVHVDEHADHGRSPRPDLAHPPRLIEAEALIEVHHGGAARSVSTRRALRLPRTGRRPPPPLDAARLALRAGDGARAARPNQRDTCIIAPARDR